MNGEVIRFPPPAAGALELARSEMLLSQHLAAAVQHLGKHALGVIDLPPLTGGSVEPAQIRVAAVVLWLREIEAAGLPSFVEVLADRVMHQDPSVELDGVSAADLGEYWRERQQRFGAEERAALYTRVVGDANNGNDEVVRALDALIGQLAAIGSLPPVQPIDSAVAQVGVIAQELAEALTMRTAGITAWATRDIVDHVKRAWKILSTPSVALALGGGDPWTILRGVGPALLGRPIDPDLHRTRAVAGQAILHWLADVCQSVEQGRLKLLRGDPVIASAQAWQAVTAAS